MGLAVIARSHMVPTEPPADLDPDNRPEDIILVTIPEHFEHSGRGLDHDTHYRTTEATRELRWRAGSYSGYSDFRRDLAAINGVTPEEVWSEPEAHLEKPFYELINFPDNEGFIGADASADLLVDFRTHREAYLELLASSAEDVEWRTEQYDAWIAGLAIAADGGFLEFC